MQYVYRSLDAKKVLTVSYLFVVIISMLISCFETVNDALPKLVTHCQIFKICKFEQKL